MLKRCFWSYLKSFRGLVELLPELPIWILCLALLVTKAFSLGMRGSWSSFSNYSTPNNVDVFTEFSTSCLSKCLIECDIGCTSVSKTLTSDFLFEFNPNSYLLTPIYGLLLIILILFKTWGLLIFGAGRFTALIAIVDSLITWDSLISQKEVCKSSSINEISTCLVCFETPLPEWRFDDPLMKLLFLSVVDFVWLVEMAPCDSWLFWGIKTLYL